jgi:hypothetical protein
MFLGLSWALTCLPHTPSLSQPAGPADGQAVLSVLHFSTHKICHFVVCMHAAFIMPPCCMFSGRGAVTSRPGCVLKQASLSSTVCVTQPLGLCHCLLHFSLLPPDCVSFIAFQLMLGTCCVVPSSHYGISVCCPLQVIVWQSSVSLLLYSILCWRPCQCS